MTTRRSLVGSPFDLYSRNWYAPSNTPSANACAVCSAVAPPGTSSVIAVARTYVKTRDLPESGVELLRRPDHLDTALHELETAKVVTFFGGGEEGVFAISPGQHLVAAFYRNNASHWFVNRAIVELVHKAEAGAKPLSPKALRKAALGG